tara:strand:- start:85 stop:336 length:252 start_codon:yes stop_codon:yes gene_type:complete
MENEVQPFIVFMSIKNEKGKVEDIPLRPFSYEGEAKVYIAGYVDAIVNHTGEANHADVMGQFSIRNVTGEINVNKSDKETKNV